MRSKELRESFIEFFKTKEHAFVPSAPMVVKDDPTLMFTNAGMNQFKDIFLGNREAKYARVANSQKCLRVSGKHNDLEEVGHDTYHHTMFEMLGNWSFGNYFKTEAIEWAWEYLTNVLGIDKKLLYVTVFEGSADDKLDPDDEALKLWEKFVPSDHIIYGSKKDYFWEMGDQGPCGPCSEIHIDLRDPLDIGKIPGSQLVNKDHHLVIEIWNLVFIQFNRKADGKLEPLPHKHVDTGMGFERLSMVVQNKKSNYDTDVFQPIIQEIAKLSGISYGDAPKTDIAMRVIADHLRAVSFAIADGQLPSNNKAGYVIRRILRRAVRYGYTFLNLDQPFINKLVPVLTDIMGEAFPEIVQQKKLVMTAILEEENTFLKTLSVGIKMLDQLIEKTKSGKQNNIDGKIAFVLYDTYGFPLDLTELIVKENNLGVDKKAFDIEMEKQKDRSRSDANTETDDWVNVSVDNNQEFIGYDYTETKAQITRYRKVKVKNKSYFHIIFNHTPFYAESGGQVGDKGEIISQEGNIDIVDTIKENNLSIHVTEKLPKDLNASYTIKVDETARHKTEANHSATHLLHFALRKILGTHVEQRGSHVDSQRLRFDFSHFQRLTQDEIIAVQKEVNRLIRKNDKNEGKLQVPIEEAQKMGAMALFGEKYGEVVRVIKFGDSVELCGGTHVNATGSIGLFLIVSESAIAAGIRRIEAITGEDALQYLLDEVDQMGQVKSKLKNPQNPLVAIDNIIVENEQFRREMEKMSKERAIQIKNNLKNRVKIINNISVIAEKIEIDSPGTIKDICFQLKGEMTNLFVVIGAEFEGKPHLAVMISDDLVNSKGLNAGNIIKDISKEIEGGGGGQAFFATAGGKKSDGLSLAIEKAINYV